MLATSHIATAILFGILGQPAGLLPSEVFLFYVAIVAAALLPDLDHPDSTLGNAFPVTAWIANKLLGHRGFMHSLVVPAILWWVIQSTISSVLAWGVLLGMLSHLLCDAMTSQGLNLFHPFGEFRIRGFVRTGGTLETIYFVGVLAAIAWRLLPL